MSLSDAADAILGVEDGKGVHPGGSGSGGATANGSAGFDTSPGAVAKNLLGKITMRKASIFSVSSIGSFVEKKSCSSTEELYPKNSRALLMPFFVTQCRKEACFCCYVLAESPRKNHAGAQEEERRKILKMLVTPQATKRTLSSVSFDSMVIKAARSAENVNNISNGLASGSSNHHDNSIIRKESSSSLQIPGLLR